MASLDKVTKVFSSKREAEEEPAPEGQMKAITYQGGCKVAVCFVEKPTVEAGTDVVVKMEAASMCPAFAEQLSNGDVPHMENGQILGSEGVGVVASVGGGVSNLAVGDRVIISPVFACGICSYCKREEFAACNYTNHAKVFMDAYGGWAPGAFAGHSSAHGSAPGFLAEYVRVPHATVNCFKLSDDISTEQAVFAADTIATGYHAAHLADVKWDQNVVIWGMGPVGLMAAKWCKLRGAGRVVGVDYRSDRLAKAKDLGVDTLDRTSMSSEQVMSKLQEMLPKGGVDAVIDACGHTHKLSLTEKMEKAVGMEKEVSEVLMEATTLVRKCGHVVVVASYYAPVDKFPLDKLLLKQLTVRGGQASVQQYLPKILDAISSGEVDPSCLLTHTMSMGDVPDAFARICKKEKGFLKVLVRISE